jgi:hypothetical protein
VGDGCVDVVVGLGLRLEVRRRAFIVTNAGGAEDFIM